ncbi:MAG: DsrE family protein [Gammaproteobacteria bacterium]|nr:DsrE family protein [Gammaproteobacteria bacterium]
MKFSIPKLFKSDSTSRARRNLLGGLLASGGFFLAAKSSRTQAAEPDPGANEEPRFPGDPAENKVVYQFNKADEAYHNAVLFSVGAMLRKYGDNIHIVVVSIGPGIHVLAKKPERPVSNEVRERIASLLQYGVEFHACGNTMKSLGWTEQDILESAKIVEVGAADLMELQQQGYAYISW